MKLKHILEQYGKLSDDNICDSLTNLGNSLFKNNWNFVNSVMSRTYPIISNKQYETEIAHDWLIYGCNIDEYNRAGYVIAVQQMYHEYRHIQQQTDEWNTITDMNSVQSINRMTDIVRRNFIKNYYDSTYTYNYAKDPAELDAEVYGLMQTFDHFESDPLVSQKEAKEILFQLMMSEEYGHKIELDQYSIRSVNDMMTAFVDLRNSSVHELYPITAELSPLWNLLQQNMI